MPSTHQTVVAVDGHRIALTNLDKVLYPETGTTKADVLEYYARVADPLIAHAAHRPVTRKRWVNGVGTADKPGQMFFQKNLDDSTPAWVKRRSIEHLGHSNDYPLLNDTATLTWLGQIAALELHVPQWQIGRTGIRKNPDRMVLDLDPGDGAGLRECAEVARLARAILTGMGLDPMPVTSGSKGIHLYSALDGALDSDAISAVAHELARALEADHPDLVVSDMNKTRRMGKVLVDWSQNSGSKTTITPYSLRGRARPTVAAPRTWDELDADDLAQLEFTEVLLRLADIGDPLGSLPAGQLAALEPTAERMAGFETTVVSRDRLARYREMRDGSKTPEPMPERSAPPSDDPSFVIQEHHARRLHFDFRLEHDGVLVSWALPKGVPTGRKANHLAVQTEDHPLEYGTFEGTIPAGQYGAGEVTIWDAGRYELEKWREDEEIIVTVKGERHGTHRYALIHTGGGRASASPADNNWLIHLMEPGASPDIGRHRSRTRRTVGGDTHAEPTRHHSPMLATLGTESEVDSDDGWAFEMKWDGIRAIARLREGTVTLVSRNGNDLTPAYPDLADIATSVAGDAVVDGEIVAFNQAGRPDFGRLQKRMNLTGPAETDAAAKAAPVQFIVFDILEVDGDQVLSHSYDERRALLERIVHPGGRVQVPPRFDGNARAAIEASLRFGLEGVIAKKRDSRYSPGRRSRSWVKIKNQLAQEVVIGGWRPGKGRRANGVGSLLMGIPDADSLVYIGRVGTGFTDRALDEMATRLRAIERKTSPFREVPSADASDARWVTPRLVGEVEFAEWTSTGRLRQPTWRGWRPDKSPGEVVREGAPPRTGVGT